MPRWLIKLSLIIFILLLSAGASLAQPLGKVGQEIDVRVLYPAGKGFQYDTVFPLVLEYKNNTSFPQKFNLSWSLDQDIPSDYRSVVLEAGATKRLPFVFPARTVGNLYDLSVNKFNIVTGLQANSQGRIAGLLVAGGDKLDYLRSLRLEKNPYHNNSATNTSKEEEYNTPYSLSNIDHEVFPAHWGPLGSLEIIVCHDLPSLGLSKTQSEALVNWVRQGGEIVFVSNGLPGEFQGSPLEEILPLRPKEVITSDGLLTVTGPLRPGSKIEFGDQQRPLMVGRRELEGKVHFITSPILDTKLIGKEQTQSMWRKVFEKAALNNNAGAFNYDILDSIPELPRTHAGWVALFVILYGLVVGPINLSVLRKRDKMLWSFVTVPVVAFFFAGGAYVVNRVIRPATPILREIGWLHLNNGSVEGVADSEQLLFSPHSDTFEITSDNKTLFEVRNQQYRSFSKSRGFSLYDLTAKSGLRSKLEMGTWDIQRFNSRALLPLESAFKLKLSADKSKVTISSPLSSDGKTAVLSDNKLGSSEVFELKKGTHDYAITFNSGHTPSQQIVFDEEKKPGRRRLTDNVWSQQYQEPDDGALYFWTDQVATPIKTTQDVIFKHDYLLRVGYRK